MKCGLEILVALRSRLPNQQPNEISTNNNKSRAAGDGLYFISFSVVAWMDVFTRREYQDILVDSISFCQKNKSLKNILLLHHAKPCSFYYVFRKWKLIGYIA
jgi:hypothetical protein